LAKDHQPWDQWGSHEDFFWDSDSRSDLCFIVGVWSIQYRKNGINMASPIVLLICYGNFLGMAVDSSPKNPKGETG
jgi:hypothetical protein